MNMEQFIEKTGEQTKTNFDKLPDIDLYMDQVIEYLARQCSCSEDGDKMSGAMINNYIKDKILPRTNGKRYGRVHLACLIMIARLKQVLTVKDIGALISELSEDDINEYFNAFQGILFKNTEELKNKIPSEDDDLRLMALDFAAAAYVNKTACEILLDMIDERK